MNYKISISKQVKLFLEILNNKSKKICKNNLKKLEENPYPGKGSGNKEKIIVKGKQRYRLHIGRTFTAFYTILENEKLIRVLEILSIEKAHKKYGY